MKRLTSICLFFAVLAGGLWPNEQPKWVTLLKSLRSERHILMLSFNSIENELSTTKQALSDLRAEYSQMENAFAEQKQLLDERRTALEERKSELEKEKARLLEHKEMLAQRERQLAESEGSLTSLRQSFEDYRKQAESELEALEVWRGVALKGIPVAILVGGILGVVLY